MWNFICKDITSAKETILMSSASEVEKTNAKEICNILFNRVDLKKSSYSLCNWWHGNTSDVTKTKKMLGEFCSDDGLAFAKSIEYTAARGAYFYTDS